MSHRVTLRSSVPETLDLVAALLEGELAQRESLLREADPAALEVALKQLGERREVAAAEVLALVDLIVEDRTLRKSARRELHRLRSVGVRAQDPQPSRTTPNQPAETTIPVSQAWVTDIDPSGSRAVWLLGERRLGGVWFAALLLNDQRGLQDMNLVDTTRKRFLKELEQNLRWQDRLADRVAELNGSWTFILGLLALTGGWTCINMPRILNEPFDPFPYVFFNLLLAILVALQGPLIVMSQNRQTLKDRAQAETDFNVNLKNEVNIETILRELGEFRAETSRRLDAVERPR